jgi:hypothetical protein
LAIALEEVRVSLDQMVVLDHTHISRTTGWHMHIGIEAPARVATVQWLGDDGKRQRQVLQLAPEEGCTTGMLVLRFVEGSDGVEVEKSVRPVPDPLPYPDDL